MNGDDISKAFDGIAEEWRAIIGRQLRNELASSITRVNEHMKATGNGREQLCPPPDLILNAFRLCPFDRLKVVLIGQDPYISQKEAMGLSFSVPRGVRVPPSLARIYQCLVYHGYVKEAPKHGDLTNWARQGVLLLNAALTTVVKKSNAHSEFWSDYTDKIISAISRGTESVSFILLGAFAQKKAKLIDTKKHVILEWGHPSPLNNANKTDNPQNFKYADVFTRANDHLMRMGKTLIDWDPDALPNNVDVSPKAAQNAVERATTDFLRAGEAGPEDPVPLDGNTYIFTDGGSKGNGRAHCKSSWAFYITDGCDIVESFGVVEEKAIPGEVFKSSNNRGELTAMARALEYIGAHLNDYDGKIVLVSDSEYAIGCLNVWVDGWLANRAKLAEKKNLDIIIPAKEQLDLIRQFSELEFRHMNSHTVEPADRESEMWFLWKGNDRVDKLCNKALGRNT